MPFIRLCFAFALCASSSLSQAEQIPIEVLSAVVKDQKIAGADVLLQRDGSRSVVGRTDTQGRVNLTTDFVDDASNLLIIKKTGFSNLVVKCPCKGMTYAVSPTMDNLDGLRVVLTWGKTPLDLDAHMVFPRNNIFFGINKGDDAYLDVDDINSYGPETITLTKKHLGKSYVYAVHDYSNQRAPESQKLSDSQAKVFVYVGESLIRTYYVPKNHTGNLWTVFRITDSGDVQDINRMDAVTVAPRNVLNEIVPLLDERASINAVAVSTQSQSEAKALNAEGENAYRAGNISQAIELYRHAIELDDAYGQAYSNLGLAYQKAGNTAESIWANRKAIALARGQSATTVRASSYYNIARIYEAAGQFSDALRHYQFASQQTSNPVYDKAIERMQKKL